MKKTSAPFESFALLALMPFKMQVSILDQHLIVHTLT